jgi:hypothetical protein
MDDYCRDRGAEMTEPKNAFERAMQALMAADPTQALFERTDRGSLRYNGVADQVRAVLEALREPSEVVIEAGTEPFDWGPGGGWGPDPNAEAVWKAMIDAILSEQEKTN